MVELRWLETTEPAYVNHQTGLSLPSVTKRALQYRTATNWRVFSDVVSIDMRDHSIATIIEWSDWQDVPTVREE